MAIQTLIALAVATHLLLYISKLYKHYRTARQTQLPIIISPFDPFGLTCQIMFRLCTPVFKRLPIEAGTWWCRICNVTWAWETDMAAHRKIGANFIMVSPKGISLQSSDPVLVGEVLARRKEFVKPDVYDNMACFGANVDTVNGKDWDRHRKLTAPCFNERVSSFVWDESLRQARSMLSIWLSQQSGIVSNMVEDTRVIAMHVLSAAGFGVSHDFSGGARLPAQGHKLSHKEALMTLLNNLITMIMLTKMGWVEKLKPVLPARVGQVFAAIHEFRQYMDEMLANERKIIANSNGASKPNLISTLIKTSDEAKAEGISSSNVRLSDDEIKGNLFIFNLAGHDTTANTLAYAVALLAAYPDLQSWAAEEVDRVLGEQKGEQLVYEEVFPKLKRILAVMYETLRLYGPVPMSPREVLTSFTPVNITDPSSASGVRTITLPANMQISTNFHAVHTTTSLFPDPKAFNPKRWINASEDFVRPEQGFWPWSGGPRICPGMKFSQVEFVGVMCTVLRGAKLLPATKDGELGFEEAKKEVLRVVRMTDASGATLSLTKPDELFIKVVKR